MAMLHEVVRDILLSAISKVLNLPNGLTWLSTRIIFKSPWKQGEETGMAYPSKTQLGSCFYNFFSHYFGHILVTHLYLSQEDGIYGL